MADRKNDPFGLFSFPVFSGQKQQPKQAFNVHQTESELIIEWQLPNFDQQEIQIEFVRNGLVIAGEKQAQNEDETKETILPHRVERFVPVYFPFTENDVTASFSEEKVLKIVIAKNDANRTFIPVQ
ncbi:Hsp20/alpha crystallin family protein [Evansella sp. AB-rgal1]|uniref:Hsp20/alpha crystallin family protein n=1 Tax=Evansella sp. AB-rgal1 TaxID=3242696 RepID=UPI00359D1D4D